MGKMEFINQNETFRVNQPEDYSYLYFPVAGEKGIKSAVTPNFGGDSKLGQNTFLMEPVSSENLHNNRSGRNFWCRIKDAGIWSATGASAQAELDRFLGKPEECELTAGFMWQTVTRTSDTYQIRAAVTSFVPLAHNVELMHVVLENTGDQPKTVTPVAAIPIYGRSADNIRDHRHVTSLLHRIRTTEYGVQVCPTMSFDERGHKLNHMTYFVCGVSGEGAAPVGFYPVVEDYIGEGGSFTCPAAVKGGVTPVSAGTRIDGREAVGALEFAEITMQPGEKYAYTVFLGATEEEKEIAAAVADYQTDDKVLAEFDRMKEYWEKKVNVYFHTGKPDYDSYMRWVSFQPILRRIYGCSFLPHHDYGKGGRGWRDLWQDCLALLIMDPSEVRQMILDNYGGVRVDGTNATIIGEKQGEFIADRNNITRVWMDHGVWPFLTTKLYIDQTGDLDILNQPASYFKDRQVERGTAADDDWDPSDGSVQKDAEGTIYRGSILEHLLLQNLCAFYEVGEHNHILLRGADWNDALDMAADRGESVAFTAAYAGNLKNLAVYIGKLKDQLQKKEFAILKEMQILLTDDEAVYDSIEKKREILSAYAKSCSHTVSGETVPVDAEKLIAGLNHKADWIMDHIRKSEWITDGEGNGWFNSYYDNHGRAVEGVFESGVRMMLTGQVFAIMSGTAEEEQIASVCKSADRYLYDAKRGGYCLNTDFRELKADLGRMFGFAYGEKENGAVFSHMTVMYANALYQRGFVKEGYKALQTLADTALNTEVSRIYPGIPEYFNASGRGMYHYLTGAASWYMLTLLTEAFGVHGEAGDLVLTPKLMPEQFDDAGEASVQVNFGGAAFKIRYRNPEHLAYGSYVIKQAALDGSEELEVLNGSAFLKKEEIAALDAGLHEIVVVFDHS